MLKFNVDENVLEKVKESKLRTEKILERYDLQQAIVNSWEVFKNELGFPNSVLIGQEVAIDEYTQNTLDLLVYDLDDSSLIVIELKRDKDRRQLLQALTYAASVSRWDVDKLLDSIQEIDMDGIEELRDRLLSQSETVSETKVILIAEEFDPEVILTSDWLSVNYAVSITAFALSLFTENDQNFISIDQRYPLKELQETFKRRKSNRGRDVQWEDVIPKLKYAFGKRGIELCQRIKAGEPGRRRFSTIRTNIDDFKSIDLNFWNKFIKVYLFGVFDGNEDVLRSKFRDEITINTWRDGLNCKVDAERQFEDLVKWLKLDEQFSVD